jgi:hypothetical protein
MSESQASFNPLFEAPPEADFPKPPPVTIDPEEIRQVREELRDRQNIHRGIAGGFVSALLAAGAWALITATTGFQHEVMAIGVGLLVGLGVRKYGRGLSPPFGVAGALLALFGSLFGNLLGYGAIAANAAGRPIVLFELQLLANPLAAAKLMADTFSPIDLGFYLVAIIMGYNISFREYSESDIAKMIVHPSELEELDV